MPTDSPISLRLYFENLHDKAIERCENIKFFIKYPTDPDPKYIEEDGKKILVTQFRRFWKLNLPALNNKGDQKQAEIEYFFKPEVPGDYLFIITKLDADRLVETVKFRYADIHGLSGRPIKQGDDWWSSHFYVSDGTQTRILLIASLTLLVSIFAFLY